MKTLYLDCSMGAAGDMLAGALYELLESPQDFLTRVRALGLPGVEFLPEKSVKCGITGTHMAVSVFGMEEDEDLSDRPHMGMPGIRSILTGLKIAPHVREQVISVYDRIAQAESQVHGIPVEQIHFHEVGSLDAIADVTAVCLLMDMLKPDKVVVSPVHVGYGSVRCAHGILPVPAPATASILKGVPICQGDVEGELCTPTGAALLTEFADTFGPMPTMRVEKIGYGMGRKDFPKANCVRAMLGEAESEAEEILELSCNVDDMTGEELGFAMERLLEAGALDACTTALGMKKSRPGTMLTALCRVEDREKLLRVFFRDTTTLGVREKSCRRYALRRSISQVETPYGTIRRKDSLGQGIQRSKYEYEDLAKIAREYDLCLEAVRKAARQAELK